MYHLVSVYGFGYKNSIRAETESFRLTGCPEDDTICIVISNCITFGDG